MIMRVAHGMVGMSVATGPEITTHIVVNIQKDLNGVAVTSLVMLKDVKKGRTKIRKW